MMFRSRLNSFHRISLAAACGFALAGLAACAGGGAARPLPVMDFAQVASAPIGVAQINVLDEALPSEQPFVVSPRGALDTYLHRRFAAQGAQGELRAVIEEAQVSQGYKPTDNRIGQFFEVAGTEEYSISVRLRLEHIDNTGLKRYSNVLRASRIVRVSEHASVDERERRQLEGLEILFQDIDREVSRIVLRDMALGS